MSKPRRSRGYGPPGYAPQGYQPPSQPELRDRKAVIVLALGLCVLVAVAIAAAISLPFTVVTALLFAGALAAILAGRVAQTSPSPLRTFSGWAFQRAGYTFLLLGLGVAALVCGRFIARINAREAAIGEQDRLRAVEAANQAARLRAATNDARRIAAPARIASLRETIQQARHAIDAGRYDEAVSLANTTTETVQELSTLLPPPDSLSEVVRDVDSVRAEAAACINVLAAAHSAADHASTAPGDNLLAYDAELAGYESTLRDAAPTTRRHLGAYLEQTIAALAQRRQEFHARVVRAQREQERMRREAYAQNTDYNWLPPGWHNRVRGRPDLWIDRARAAGPNGTILRLESAIFCSQQLVDEVGRLRGDTMRSLGFEHFECVARTKTLFLDLRASADLRTQTSASVPTRAAR